MRPLPLAIPVALAIPSVVLASEFSDFRIPEHRWQTLSVSFDASGSRYRENGYSPVRASRELQGSSGTVATWARDGDKRSYILSLDGAVSGNRRFRSEEYSFVSLQDSTHARDETESRNVSERWGLTAELRHFPWRAPFGALIRGRWNADYGQLWESQKSRRDRIDTLGFRRSENSRRDELWVYRNSLEADVSLGHGRVRDASGVQWARVLEARLLQIGAIRAPLSRGAKEKIAALFYLRPSLWTAHERPDRFFWREVERVLREDGVVDDQHLDAFAWLRAAEPYGVSAAQASFSRPSGHYLGALATFERQPVIGRQTSSFEDVSFSNDTLVARYAGEYSRRAHVSPEAVMVGAEAELHLPAGPRWQIDASGRVVGQNHKFPRTADVNSSAAASYLVADRWAITGSVFQARHIRRAGPFQVYASEGWSVAYSIGAAFFVEDRLLLRLSASENQDRYSQRDYRRESRFSLGLTYRFIGALQAPGLIDPMRLLPVTKPPY